MDSVEIEVFDVQGKLIFKEIHHSNRISLLINESKGIFYLRIKNKNSSIGFRKIVLL
jgi:hypothetical protein